MPLFFLLCLIISNSWSQNVTSIKGKVLERGTRKKMTDVSVFVLPHKLKATTNSQGEFTFEGVPEGDCTLIVNVTGYDKYESIGSCKKTDDLVIYVEKKDYTNFETTVTGKVTKRDDTAQSLTQEEFIKAPGTFGGDPVRAAQNLPGVAQAGASAQIIVQGASPDDTGYVINGHRVPIVFHFGGLSSVIIPQAVERVDLLPSGYGPEYSKAIGGIIGLTTKDPKNDRLHGMAFVDILNTGGMIEGPIDDKSSFLVAGRYSYIGQVLKQVASSNKDLELTAAPTYYDFTSVYKRQLNEKNKFTTTIVASRDELQLIFNKSPNNDPGLRGNFYNRTEFFRIIPQITTQLNATTKMDHSIALGRDSVLVDVGSDYLDLNTNVISQRSEIIKEWKPTYKTYVGLDNQFNDSNSRINLPSTYSIGGVGNPFSVGDQRKFDTKQQTILLGGYLRQEIKSTADSKWTYLPNFRYDYFSTNKSSRLQPRFQLRYQSDPTLLLRASVGEYMQPPQPGEVNQYYGNKNILSPRAIHYTAGYTKDFRGGSNQGLEFTNNYFFKQLKDLVVPDVATRYSNTGTGTIVGAEVQAKYRKNEWTGQIVYTFLKSRRTIPGYGTRPSQYDQTHNLNIIGSYNKERWTFSGRFRYVTGNPYTPIVGSTFDTDNDVYIPSRGTIYSQRFDAFNQLDIRIDRKYIYDKWILTAYLDILNLYNSANIQSYQYSYDYTDKKKVRGLPILPTIGLKGEF
jgi:hypothetical protein